MFNSLSGNSWKFGKFGKFYFVKKKIILDFLTCIFKKYFFEGFGHSAAVKGRHFIFIGNGESGT